MKIKSFYFTHLEILLFCGSVALTVVPFFLFSNESLLSLFASLVGISSLILCAKGNPLGQVLMIVFSALYGIVSFQAAYYGEMLTYLGMSAPMALLSLISWLRHPYRGERREVAVRPLTRASLFTVLLLTAGVTALFIPLLSALGTARLLPSTVSVATSLLAASLTYLRSPYYALAYAANDVVLILLWVLQSLGDREAISVVTCFIAFLVNDLYGFFSWMRMARRQGRAHP